MFSPCFPFINILINLLSPYLCDILNSLPLHPFSFSLAYVSQVHKRPLFKGQFKVGQLMCHFQELLFLFILPECIETSLDQRNSGAEM